MALAPRFAALTDIGLHRSTNEDSYVAEPPLFAVCDGMGGARAGEVASGLAAQTLAREVAAGRPLPDAAREANAAVFAHANDNVEHTGMGTTLTALLLEDDEGHIAHVGDSRAYLLRDGELRQLTDDHSLVGEMVREGRLTAQEAAVHPHRSILSRALGTEPAVQIDDFAVSLRAGDVLLLCSDGLCGVVPDDALRRQLGRSDPADAARRLVHEARKQGGPDNITAVVLRLDEAESAEDEAGRGGLEAGAAPVPDDVAAERHGGEAPREAARRSRRRLLVVAAVLAVVVLLALSGALGLSFFYYVGVDQGRLAVFSGLPESVGPLNLHAVYRESAVSYSSLSAGGKRAVDARRVGTRADAFALAADLGMWP